MHVFGQFTYVLVCKNVCQASLPSFLLLEIFCFDQCQSKWKFPVQQLSFFVTGRRYLNGAYATYAQHFALRSVYKKGKLVVSDFPLKQCLNYNMSLNILKK